MKDEGNYESIATKVSMNAFAMITAISGRMRKTVYDFMQSIAAFIIHCFDNPHGLSEQEEAMKREWMEIANKELNLCEPDMNFECIEATFYLCDKVKDKKATSRSKIMSDAAKVKTKPGVVAALIKRPFFGQSEITYNHRIIIERAFCLLYPKTYKQLRVIGSAIGSTSVLETILMLMVKAEDGINTDEIHAEFSDNERSEWGKQMAEQPFKRKVSRSVNDETMQMDFGMGK